MDTEIHFFALNSTKEKVLDRVQQQPLIPPKRFDIFPHWLGDAQKVEARSDFSLNNIFPPDFWGCSVSCGAFIPHRVEP